MNSLTQKIFEEWLEKYGQASAENDAKASSELFSLDAKYYESPFDAPMIGRQAIYQYWENAAHNLKDKESSYEVLAVKEDHGLARWQAKFVNIYSGNQVALDCVFLVEFDENQQCKVFREWWHSQVIDKK